MHTNFDVNLTIYARPVYLAKVDLYDNTIRIKAVTLTS